jgi:hypothetical protein
MVLCCILKLSLLSGGVNWNFYKVIFQTSNILSLQIRILHYLSLSLSLWLYSPLLGLGHFFSFLIFYTLGRAPWMGNQPVARPLPTHKTAQTQNKRTQSSMPRVRFEPTTPVFEQAKTDYALDHATTIIGY